MQFIKESNSKNKTKIVPVLVNKGLTHIIQVPDVAINKTFKQTLKDQYYKHQLELEITIGRKLRVAREKMVEFIVNAIDEINDISTKTLMIQDAFKYCG
jgi:CRISPR/Cas system CSM-associated protein Csm2 small subunit